MSGERFVIVELFDDAPMSADQVAAEIVFAMADDVKLAYAASDDRFGRLVRPVDGAIHENKASL